MNRTNPAVLKVTKLLNSFIGKNGEKVDYESVEIEFAPNCFATFKFNANNQRVLQKYSPDMYHFLSNVPYGLTVDFVESPRSRDGIVDFGIGSIYSGQKEENEL